MFNSEIIAFDACLRDEKLRAKIKKFLLGAQGATVFHTPEWLATVSKAGKKNGFYVLTSSKNELAAVTPFFEFEAPAGVDLFSGFAPFETIYGGPAIYPEFLTAGQDVLRSVKKTLAGAFKISRMFWYPANRESEGFFLGNGFQKELIYQTPVWDISADSEDLWQSLPAKSVRYEIRKARKRQPEVHENELSHLPEFYSLLKAIFEKAGNTPQSEEFYTQIFKALLSAKSDNSPECVLFTSLIDDVLAGGVSGLRFGKTLHYFVSATSFEGRRAGLNDFLLWKLVEWGKQNGCTHFDLLRVPIEGAASNMEGVRKFKLKYCKALEPLHLYKTKSVRGVIGSAYRRVQRPFSKAAQSVEKLV